MPDTISRVDARAIAARSPAERSLRLLAVASVLLPLLAFATASWIAHGHAFADATQRLERTLDLVHEHAAKVFETHDLIGAQANLLLAGLSDDAVRAREPDLHQRLARIATPLAQITNVWVIDAAGRPLVASAVSPVPPNLDFSDRAYYRVHRDGMVPRGHDYVGKIIVGRPLGQVTFQVSIPRDIEPRSDTFAGVIAVSVNPAYFHDFYEHVASGGGATIMSLMRDDGVVLARYPALPGATALRALQGPVMRGIAHDPERGIVEGASDLDGVSRIVAYWRLPGQPVYVTAGIDRAVVIRSWLTTMASHLIFGVPATAGLLVLSLFALRRTRREAGALASLRAETARREATEEQLRQARNM